MAAGFRLFDREGLVTTQRQALYLSHGAGPLPLLGDTSHEEMVRCLKQIAATMAKPSAIVVVSAHWEEGRATLTSAANPPLIYDYHGFPQESYEIEYPCPGAPALAARIAGQLAAAGIHADLDGERGFDHGLFVPLKIMYPGADIPCVQLSLLKSLDAAEHIRMGRALQGPGDGSLLVIGSGFSFHNMRAFFAPETDSARAMNEGFEAWLLDTCCNPDMGEAERTQRLVGWEDAPFARYCHPREEHLLPLHVCYGYAATACLQSFELQILNKKSSMYLWQAGS
jgi:aromatic ring-opening dioxygenase catalytic subunit (LigB family)